MEIYNRKPYVTAIVIFVLISLGLGGYIVYDYFYKKEDKVKVVTMVDDVKINLNTFYQISDTLERFDLAFNNHTSDYFGYIYNEKVIKVKEFDEDAALYSAMIKELVPSNVNQTIVADKVNGNMESMYGIYLKYNNKTLDVNDRVKINYDSNTSTYSYNIPTNTANYSEGYVTKSVKTILKEDAIVVTRKVYYVVYNGTDGNTTRASIYKDENKGYKLGEVKVKNGEANEKEVLDKYGTRLNTYDVTFIKNSDEDYTFNKIEKVR